MTVERGRGIKTERQFRLCLVIITVVTPKTIQIITIKKEALARKAPLDFGFLDVDVYGVLILAACELQQTLSIA